MNIASLKSDLNFTTKGPKISVLLETENTKEIRILLGKNQEMKEHQTPFPICVEVFSGKIEFGVHGEHIVLGSGQLISLDGGVPHNLIAIDNSIIRLSLSKKDTIQRVKNIVN